ncbi:hypothetical protein SESI111939_19810 [Serratia silvae]
MGVFGLAGPTGKGGIVCQGKLQRHIRLRIQGDLLHVLAA